MDNFIPVRSKKILWNEVIVKGFRDGLKAEQIREKLIDIVRKETFDQLMSRMRVADPSDAPQTPRNEKIVENIRIQTENRWASLIRECNKHLQTLNLIRPEDLKKIFPQEEEEEEDVPEVDEMTAEWPELAEAEEEYTDEAADQEDHVQDGENGLAEGAGELAGEPGEPEDPADVDIPGSTAEEIRPGMRFPAGHWLA